MRVLPESDADPESDPDPDREAVPRNSPSNAGGAPATSRRDTVAPMPLNLSSSQSDICSSPSPSAEMLGKEQASFRVSTKRLPLVSTNCRILACSVIGPLSAGVAKKPQGTPQRNIGHPQERAKGIEPSPPAWKAGALPLSYARAGPTVAAAAAAPVILLRLCACLSGSWTCSPSGPWRGTSCASSPTPGAWTPS